MTQQNAKPQNQNNEDLVPIFTKYITIKGRRIYAHEYGLEAFKIWIPRDKLRK